MKLFVDMAPALAPTPQNAGWLCLALAPSLLAAPREETYFVAGERLLPHAFVDWMVAADPSGAALENGAAAAMLADGEVETGRLGRALAKHDAEAAVWVAIDPFLSPEAGPERPPPAAFDAAIAVVSDPTLLCAPHLLGASAERADAARAAAAGFDRFFGLTGAALRDLTAAQVAAPSRLLSAPSAVLPPVSPPSAPAADASSQPFLAFDFDAPRDNLGLIAAAWGALAPPERGAGLVVAGGRCVAAAALWPEPQAEQVRIAPRRSMAQLRALLGRSRAFLTPSLSDPSGRWAAEATALGAPVIAAVGGGAAERSQSAALRLVDPCCPAQLAAAMSEITGAEISGLEITASSCWGDVGAALRQAARALVG